MVEPGSSLKVDLSSYCSDFKRITSDLLYVDRTINRMETQTDIDVIGRFWIFTKATICKEEICVFRKGGKLTDEGAIFVFVPPFSIIEWGHSPGSLRSESYFSTVPIPEDLPTEAIAFKSCGDCFPQTAEEVFEIVRNARDVRIISKEEKVSAIALKTRQILIQTYSEPVSLSKIAWKLKIAHPDMTRAFRECYGCTPVVYRTRLRTMDALWQLLTQDHPIATTAFEVGFGDVSRFNKQFRSHMHAAPSKFVFRK